MKIKFLIGTMFSDDCFTVRTAKAGDELDVADTAARCLVADGKAEFVKRPAAKSFRLRWPNGATQLCEGDDIADALVRLGHPARYADTIRYEEVAA